jgi:hypothetical protein
LYNVLLTWISGELWTAISQRNLDNWAKLKKFPKNLYIKKRTLDFRVSQLFIARQGKD